MKRRNTQSKSDILEVLRTKNTAMSHDMILHDLSSPIDRTTIYRVLNQFLSDGIVHKIVGDDGKQYFALCHSCNDHKHHHNHFHFRCSVCGKVDCLNDEINIVLPAGYITEHFNGSISGKCNKCT